MQDDKQHNDNEPILTFHLHKKLYANATSFKLFSVLVGIAVLLITGTILGTFFIGDKKTNTILLARENTLNEELTKIENQNDILEAEIILLKNEVKSLAKRKDKRKIAKISKYIADTQLEGAGVEIILNDNNSDFAPAQEEYTVIHNTDLLKIVNFLWSENATAISINDERIGSNTSISCVGPTIIINKKRINTPFIINAIGKNLDKNMIQNSSVMLSLKLRGIEYDIHENSHVLVPESKYTTFSE